MMTDDEREVLLGNLDEATAPLGWDDTKYGRIIGRIAKQAAAEIRSLASSLRESERCRAEDVRLLTETHVALVASVRAESKRREAALREQLRDVTAGEGLHYSED